jgi:outer membrane receptor protein involved in Fe transport
VFDFALRQGPGLISLFNQNFTDVRTYGLRAEARKLAAAPLLLTYGVDVVRERVEGTDNNRTSVTGFGPPFVETSTRPQIPEASFNTLGLFLQGEVEVTDRFSFVAGGRYQRVAAATFATPGLEDQQPTSITDATFVGALNSIVEMGGGFTLVGALGRAFRSPNLIERFFDGPAPEGNGYQVRNPALESETSFNVDLGVRYNRGALSAQAFAFRNKISDGIRTEPLENEVEGLPAFRNTNVDELVFRGFELAGDAGVGHGFSVGTSFTRLQSKDALNEDNPVGETFSSRLTGTVRYEDPSDRVWAAWEVRHNGERKDVALAAGHLLGDALPAFTVMDVRAGVTVLRTDGGMVHRLSATVSNVTDALYAEFSNASFFRPEPKRNLSLRWDVSF